MQGKSAVLAKICMNFKDLGVIYRSRGISLPEIVVWGGVGIVGSRVLVLYTANRFSACKQQNERISIGIEKGEWFKWQRMQLSTLWGLVVKAEIEKETSQMHKNRNSFFLAKSWYRRYSVKTRTRGDGQYQSKVLDEENFDQTFWSKYHQYQLDSVDKKGCDRHTHTHRHTYTHTDRGPLGSTYQA